MKTKEMAIKFIELQKRHEKTKEKLEVANMKIVELLHNKIELGSPKANNKKQHNFTDLKYPSRVNVNHPDPESNGSDLTQEFYEKREHPVNIVHPVKIVEHHHHNRHMEQIPHHQRVEKQSRSGSKEFYERSLRLRSNHKYKELKCANHSISEENIE